MTVILAALGLLQSSYTKPAGWVDQKIAEGVTISAPRPLKKDTSDPELNKDGQVWIDDSGSVIYGFRLPKPRSKSLSVNDTLAGFCDQCLADIAGSIDGEKDLLSQGWRGIALTINGSGKTAAIRGFFYRDRIVAGFVIFDRKSKRPDSVDQFLNSIRFDSFGTAVAAGPELTRFTVAQSGVSALFPSKPEDAKKVSGVKDKDLIFSYASDYCNLTRSVNCFDVTSDAAHLKPDELPAVYSLVLDGYLEGDKVKTTAERMLFLGGVGNGLYREYKGQGTAGAVAVILHGKQFFLFDVVGPNGYAASQQIDAFFKSIQFAGGNAVAATVAQQVQAETGKDWKEQTIVDGIKVTAPVTLKKMDLSSAAKEPGVAGTTLWMGKNDGYALEFAIVRASRDGESDAQILSEYLGGILDPGETLDGERNIVSSGWNGIATTTVDKDGVAFSSRSFALANKVVAVTASYPAGVKRPEDIDKYFDSLRFPATGPAKMAGPVLSRFTLGDSGISALFPYQPDKKDGVIKGKKGELATHIYGAGYCLRPFVVSFVTFPPEAPEPTQQERDQFFTMMLDGMLVEIGAKQTKQRDMGFGEDVGLYREFTAENNFAGSIAIMLHKHHIVMMMTMAPKVYSDPATIDAFYKSLQFKD